MIELDNSSKKRPWEEIAGLVSHSKRKINDSTFAVNNSDGLICINLENVGSMGVNYTQNYFTPLQPNYSLTFKDYSPEQSKILHPNCFSTNIDFLIHPSSTMDSQGNRDELSTPITITGFDNSSGVSADSYLSNQMNDFSHQIPCNNNHINSFYTFDNFQQNNFNNHYLHSQQNQSHLQHTDQQLGQFHTSDHESQLSNSNSTNFSIHDDGYSLSNQRNESLPVVFQEPTYFLSNTMINTISDTHLSHSICIHPDDQQTQSKYQSVVWLNQDPCQQNYCPSDTLMTMQNTESYPLVIGDSSDRINELSHTETTSRLNNNTDVDIDQNDAASVDSIMKPSMDQHSLDHSENSSSVLSEHNLTSNDLSDNHDNIPRHNNNNNNNNNNNSIDNIEGVCLTTEIQSHPRDNFLNNHYKTDHHYQHHHHNNHFDTNIVPRQAYSTFQSKYSPITSTTVVTTTTTVVTTLSSSRNPSSRDHKAKSLNYYHSQHPKSINSHSDNPSNHQHNNNNSSNNSNIHSNIEKKCKVCGDRAVNHNFGQLTCESCKAFFRRNAHKGLTTLMETHLIRSNDTSIMHESNRTPHIRSRGFVELTCTAKSGEHVITPTTRRECPSCRLKQCFRVGMRPDLIQVRKKDGSKPRWLDKVPSAAIVHEQHLQSSESLVWSTNNNMNNHNRSDCGNKNNLSDNGSLTLIHRTKYRLNSDKCYKTKGKEYKLLLTENDHKEIVNSNNNETSLSIDDNNTNITKNSVNFIQKSTHSKRYKLNSNEIEKYTSDHYYPSNVNTQITHPPFQEYDTNLVPYEQLNNFLMPLSSSSSVSSSSSSSSSSASSNVSDIVNGLSNSILDKDLSVNTSNNIMTTNNSMSNISSCNNNIICPSGINVTTNYLSIDGVFHINELMLPNSYGNNENEVNLMNPERPIQLTSSNMNILCNSDCIEHDTNDNSLSSTIVSVIETSIMTMTTTTGTTISNSIHNPLNLLSKNHHVVNFKSHSINHLDDLILLTDSTQLLEHQSVTNEKLTTQIISALSLMTPSTISNELSINNLTCKQINDSITIPSCLMTNQSSVCTSSNVISSSMITDTSLLSNTDVSNICPVNSTPITSNCLPTVYDQSLLTSLWDSSSLPFEKNEDTTIPIFYSDKSECQLPNNSIISTNQPVQIIPLHNEDKLSFDSPIQTTMKSLSDDLLTNELPLLPPSSETTFFTSSSSSSSSSSSAAAAASSSSPLFALSVSKGTNEAQYNINSMHTISFDNNCILPVDLNNVILLDEVKLANSLSNYNSSSIASIDHRDNNLTHNINSTILTCSNICQIKSANHSLQKTPEKISSNLNISENSTDWKLNSADNEISSTNDTVNPSSVLSNGRLGRFLDLDTRNTCIPLNLNDVNKAWSCMWRNGLFPNPEQIDLNLDTTQRPPLKWCLTIANIWSDLFLRRVSVFAMSLLGDLVQEDCKSRRSLKNKVKELSTCTTNNEYVNGFNQFGVTFQEELDSQRRDKYINCSITDSNDPLLTWDDMLWIAKNRFTDCVPVLLISCSSCTNRNTTSSIPDHQHTTELRKSSSQLLINDKLFDSMKPSPYQCSISSSNTLKQDKQNSKLIYFQSEDNHINILDLTKLSNALGELGTEYSSHTTNNGYNNNNNNNGSPITNNKQIAYPILKYLDAYISQLGSFLAHHPVLLGAYMALKLTDPILVKDEEIYNQLLEDHNVNEGQQQQQQQQTICLQTNRNQRLHRLYSHFLKIFNEAIDYVSEESIQLKINQQINKSNNDILYSYEKIATNSRRSMLSEFLDWSREFDATWHSFQSDIWRQTTAYNNNGNNIHQSNKKIEYKISKGLNILFDKDLKFYDDGENDLVHLLWDANNELSFDA